MLSHTSSNMEPRQRHHLRQQSVPNTSGSFVQQTPGFHGHPVHQQSMTDIHAQQQYQYPQDQVSITNQGHQPQHYLQATQQQRQAGPGIQQGTPQPLQLSEQEFRSLYHQQLDAQLDSMMRSRQLPAHPNQQHIIKIERSRSNPESYDGMGFLDMPNDSAFLTQGFPVTVDKSRHPGQERPSSSQSAKTRHERGLSAQPTWTMVPQRPFTPQNSNNHGNNPLTPSSTPRSSHRQSEAEYLRVQTLSPSDVGAQDTIRGSASRPAPQRYLANSFDETNGSDEMDTSVTIKPTRRTQAARAISLSKIFAIDSDVSVDNLLPSPPATESLGSSRKYDTAILPSAPEFDENPTRLDFGVDGKKSSATRLQPALELIPVQDSRSIPSSPEFSHARTDSHTISEFDRQSSPCTTYSLHSARHSVDWGHFDSSTELGYSPEAMSVEDFDPDAAIEDTGISPEEVQSYISEQDSTSGKWTCMYPDCGKLFGRKENIRSHVQTHLGDRQFRCVHCNKKFVRQHDLKRHSKTHSGVKPYPCQCGNSFARHDALTRHRQRGICTGGFPGVVKKSVKRGRPRKHRTDDEARLSKAMRTRKRALEQASASSVSGTSDSSLANSPEFALLESFTNSSQFRVQNQSLDTQYFPPNVFSYTPPLSPTISTGNVGSPQKALSPQKPTQSPPSPTPEESLCALLGSQENLLLGEAIPDSQLASQPGSPPELSHSSPPSSTQLMDLDLGTAFGSSGTEHSEHNKQDNDSVFDMFSGADNSQSLFESEWNDGNFLNFDKEPNGLRLSGFEGAFDDNPLFSDHLQNNDNYA